IDPVREIGLGGDLAVAAKRGGRGMAILTLGIMIGAASQNFTQLALSRILEGFGFLLVVVAGPAILMRIVASARRDLVLALWSCFMPAAMAIAMLSGPLFASWQAIWWINGLIALLSLLTAIAAVSPSQSGPRASAGGFRADAIATLTSRGPVLRFSPSTA
ncbi:MAG: MFS transporter, partial [Ensifer adhaerens]